MSQVPVRKTYRPVMLWFWAIITAVSVLADRDRRDGDRRATSASGCSSPVRRRSTGCWSSASCWSAVHLKLFVANGVTRRDVPARCRASSGCSARWRSPPSCRSATAWSSWCGPRFGTPPARLPGLLGGAGPARVRALPARRAGVPGHRRRWSPPASTATRGGPGCCWSFPVRCRWLAAEGLLGLYEAPTVPATRLLPFAGALAVSLALTALGALMAPAGVARRRHPAAGRLSRRARSGRPRARRDRSDGPSRRVRPRTRTASGAAPRCPGPAARGPRPPCAAPAPGRRRASPAWSQASRVDRPMPAKHWVTTNRPARTWAASRTPSATTSVSPSIVLGPRHAPVGDREGQELDARGRGRGGRLGAARAAGPPPRSARRRRHRRRHARGRPSRRPGQAPPRGCAIVASRPVRARRSRVVPVSCTLCPLLPRRRPP